jgi:hypothetical protein
MASRSKSGSKVVVACVAATLTAVGVGTIYLPFIADRDRIRGLHEESELTPAERREYERALRHGANEIVQKQDTTTQDGPMYPKMPSNSVWKRMEDVARAKREGQ